MRRTGLIFATATLMTFLVSDAFAGTCNINGSLFGSTIGDPVLTSTNGQFAGNVCGNTVYGSSGTCYLQIDNDDSISGGDCLTVGKNVVITVGTNHTLTCSDTSCGSAINASTSGSGNTTINGLEIEGCWTSGIETITTSDNYKNLRVDLTILAGAGSWCVQSWREAIVGSPNLIEDSDIVGGDTAFVGCLETAGIVRDSSVSKCNYAIDPTSSTVLENVMFYNNRITFWHPPGDSALKSSHIVTGPDTYLDIANGDVPCHCYDSGDCYDMSVCFDFTGQISFVDDVIYE